MKNIQQDGVGAVTGPTVTYVMNALCRLTLASSAAFSAFSAFVHPKEKKERKRSGIFEDLKLDLGEGGEGNKSNPSAYDTAVSGTLK